MHVAPQRALLAVVITTGACFAYRRAALVPEPGSHVRVVLTTAIAVTTHVPGPKNAHRVYPGVLEASGAIEAAAGDTVALRLGELRTAGGPVPDVSGQVAMLPTAHIARIEQRRFQAGTTILAGVGLFALAATTYVILLIVAITHAF
jgi:hypothetical protein